MDPHKKGKNSIIKVRMGKTDSILETKNYGKKYSTFDKIKLK